MPPFESDRASKIPDWRIVFDLVQGMSPDQIIRYEELELALGTSDRMRVYRAVGAANRKLWKNASKSLDTVRGTGYRVMRADEHESKALRYKKRARRQMSNSVAVMEATDLDKLPADKREWAVNVTAGLKLLAMGLDAQAEKVKKHADMIDSLQRRVDKLEGTSGE